MGAEQKLRIDQIIEWLDTADYFQILNVPQMANSVEIKQAYFKLSRQYHPDRYFSNPDKGARDKINMVFKRLNEAYAILKNPDKRERYKKNITGAERAKHLRYQASDEDRGILQSPENQAKTPNGKKYLKLALIAQQKKDWRNAEMNLRFAVNFEPENDFIKKLVETVKAEVAKLPKIDPFKIR